MSTSDPLAAPTVGIEPGPDTLPEIPTPGLELGSDALPPSPGPSLASAPASAPAAVPARLGVARLRDLCIDARDPVALSRFWASALGRDVEFDEDGDAYLRGGLDGPGIWIVRVPEPKTAKDRIHLDLTLQAGQEVTDLLTLGARVLTEPDAVGWWVLEDPEGNEFCVFPADADATNDADAEVPAAADARP